MKLFGAVVVAMALVLPFALTRSVPPVSSSGSFSSSDWAIPCHQFADAFCLCLCLDLEPSLLIGDSWSITWQLPHQLLLQSKVGRELFSDRHLRHGEDSKEVLLGQEEERAWQLWKEKVKHFKKRRQQGAAPISKKIIHHSKCEGNIHGSKLCFWMFWTQCKKKSDLNVHKKNEVFQKKRFEEKTQDPSKTKKGEFLNNSRSIFLVVSEATVSDLPCAHHKILKIPQAYALLAAVFWQGSSSGSRNGSWKILEIFQLNSMWYWDTGSMYPGYFVALFVGWWWGLLIMMVVFQRWW